MKKSLLFALALIAALFANAGSVTLKTSLPVGTTIKLLPNATSATYPITIDWGNGVPMNYTVDPSAYAYSRWVTGTVEGETITISGQLTELTMQECGITDVLVEGMSNLTKLDLAKNEIVAFELADTTPLTDLNLSYNKIVNSPSVDATLSLEYAGRTLTTLSLAHNENLMCLNAGALVALKYLSINDCPDFSSIFICMPEASQTELYSINLSNCDLAHFYPVGLPNLRSLDLQNNNLMSGNSDDPFVLGDYPSLTTLNVAGNRGITALDISQCKKLERLYINDCNFSSIDVAQAPDLATLNMANNKIASLDLGNNKKLTYLNISNNPIATLDISKLLGNEAFQPTVKLQTLNISGTDIAVVDLIKCPYLSSFEAKGTKLQFVDFNGQQAGRMTKIDLRDCPEFTYESMAYTVKTLPQAKSSYSTDNNLLLSGSNAEKADIQYATSGDMNWHCDVTGDGTAVNNELALTLEGATPTGAKKTGTLDRLYPIFGLSLEYDLTEYQTAGGKFLLVQWNKPWFQTVHDASPSAWNGVPIYVYTYPEEGKRFRSVTVNGKEITSQWFMITEPSTVKVNYVSEDASIALTVPQGQSLSFLVNTTQYNGSVWVDWGTGTRIEYPGQRAWGEPSLQIGGTRIEGSAASNTVTIYGDIAALDAEGYGDVAEYFGLWDNHISGVTLNGTTALRYLNLRWNPVTTLDISEAPDLQVLDVSYCALQQLDLSANPGILALVAYSDGFDDEDSGIRSLTSLDVTGLPYLQYLDAKNNGLTSLDLTHNPWLYYLNLANNELSTLDLSANTELESLSLSRNKLTTLDVSKLTSLMECTVDGNLLTSVDFSKCALLGMLSVANNDIHSLDLSKLTKLYRLNINGNGMTADELNDLYYLLPKRFDYDEGENATSWNLAVIQGLDKAENDGLRADSSIAEDRGWTPSHRGSNGGSEFSYLDIIQPVHGTIEVKDAEGNVYTHGSKVKKYLPLTIHTTADAGYEFKHHILNNQEAVYEPTFIMPGIYTKLAVSIGKMSGIADTDADAFTIAAAHGNIIVKGNGPVEIFNATGICIASATVDTAAAFAVAPGYYIVRTPAGASAVIVK